MTMPYRMACPEIIKLVIHGIIDPERTSVRFFRIYDKYKMVIATGN
jgi:hypothetical protein